jgi:hypothetical protein
MATPFEPTGNPLEKIMAQTAALCEIPSELQQKFNSDEQYTREDIVQRFECKVFMFLFLFVLALLWHSRVLCSLHPSHCPGKRAPQAPRRQPLQHHGRSLLPSDEEPGPQAWAGLVLLPPTLAPPPPQRML